MKIYLYPVLLLGLLSGCTRTDLDLSGPVLRPVVQPMVAALTPAARAATGKGQATDPALGEVVLAEVQAAPAAREVLRTGRKLALEERAIIRGSCWNWINTVFHRAGYGDNNRILFKGRKQGPYAKPGQIRPGDWLYFVNHSYNRVGHSGIFVHWIDFDRKIGKVLSYGGEGRRKPGRYKAYNLKDVYFIKRPGGDTEDTRVAQAG
ncbi:hypothetical protein D5125_08120 [Magnetovirga frankeli]|uniref:hypothetical protein n=1 Tax=Magnetovirga frankeli TaxID=947516 RepID=UPI001293F0D2|nr:hypothetical protein D5125_08120 [gamma proteobacterium SS-5]